jgi:hypothetical protein
MTKTLNLQNTLTKFQEMQMLLRARGIETTLETPGNDINNISLRYEVGTPEDSWCNKFMVKIYRDTVKSDYSWNRRAVRIGFTSPLGYDAEKRIRKSNGGTRTRYDIDDEKFSVQKMVEHFVRMKTAITTEIAYRDRAQENSEKSTEQFNQIIAEHFPHLESRDYYAYLRKGELRKVGISDRKGPRVYLKYSRELTPELAKRLESVLNEIEDEMKAIEKEENTRA